MCQLIGSVAVVDVKWVKLHCFIPNPKTIYFHNVEGYNELKMDKQYKVLRHFLLYWYKKHINVSNQTISFANCAIPSTL